jgi:hypothetical protein
MAPSSGAAVIILIGISGEEDDDEEEEELSVGDWPLWKDGGVRLAAPYMSSRSAKDEATRKTEGLCTPFLVGFRNGPST